MPLDLLPDPVPLTHDDAGVLRVAGTDISFVRAAAAARGLFALEAGSDGGPD
jgi:hypothetical protein